MKMSQIKAGDVVKMIARTGYTTREQFLGFTTIDEKYSETPVFNTLKEVKEFYGVKNAREIDNLGIAHNLPYGHGVYACFKNLDDDEKHGGYTWQAYLYEGRWVLGSGCTHFSIEKVA